MGGLMGFLVGGSMGLLYCSLMLLSPTMAGMRKNFLLKQVPLITLKGIVYFFN
jgi:hypothetical protein